MGVEGLGIRRVTLNVSFIVGSALVDPDNAGVVTVVGTTVTLADAVRCAESARVFRFGVGMMGATVADGTVAIDPTQVGALDVEQDTLMGGVLTTGVLTDGDCAIG